MSAVSAPGPGIRPAGMGEVLSFTRLAGRVFAQMGGRSRAGSGRRWATAGHGAAVEQLRPRLKAYAAVGTRPEFLSALVTAVDEFKSCCVTREALQAAARQSEGILAEKLEELSLLLRPMMGFVQALARTPETG